MMGAQEYSNVPKRRMSRDLSMTRPSPLLKPVQTSSFRLQIVENVIQECRKGSCPFG